MDAAIPIQIVDTLLFMKFIVSYIAIPDVIAPPGEFMYRFISSCDSESRYSSSATIMFAVVSFISPFRIIILSFSSLE